MNGVLGGLAPIWRNSTIPCLAANKVEAVSTITPNTPPARPKRKAEDDSSTGTVDRLPPPPNPKNTLPRSLTTPMASKGPRITAGVARRSPSTSASDPTWPVVAPRLFNIAISAARDFTTKPVIRAR